MMAFPYLSASFLRLGRRKKENMQNYKKVFFIVIFSWEKIWKIYRRKNVAAGFDRKIENIRFLQ
jgi:hypothetical protein